MKDKENKTKSDICIVCGYDPKVGDKKRGACYVYGDKISNRHTYKIKIKKDG